MIKLKLDMKGYVGLARWARFNYKDFITRRSKIEGHLTMKAK